MGKTNIKCFYKYLWSAIMNIFKRLKHTHTKRYTGLWFAEQGHLWVCDKCGKHGYDKNRTEGNKENVSSSLVESALE